MILPKQLYRTRRSPTPTPGILAAHSFCRSWAHSTTSPTNARPFRLHSKSSSNRPRQRQCQRRSLVSLHGTNPFSTDAADSRRRRSSDTNGAERSRHRPHGATIITTPPPDPSQVVTSEEELRQKIEQVAEWMTTSRNSNKKKKKASGLLCLTGAGVSTESGVPDYRGHNGAYLRGHRPMLHEQFVSSHSHRQRYWGRGMVGWRAFWDRQPNRGHAALAQLEQMGHLGVPLEDAPEYHRHGANAVDFAFGSGHRALSVVTQNVDSLHQRAGSIHVLDLHGRTDRVRCMHCGAVSCRNEFHDELERVNAEWLAEALQNVQKGDTRPDGDAETRDDSDYSDLRIPDCKECTVGFVKPDVVFFGDTVPRHRVALCSAAIAHADGLLVVGTSLAVHSAYRHVRAASQLEVPICIVNVGETRAEAEGLSGILKVEAPAGPTLAGVADYLAAMRDAA